jgi:hypothetical protein
MLAMDRGGRTPAQLGAVLVLDAPLANGCRDLPLLVRVGVLGGLVGRRSGEGVRLAVKIDDREWIGFPWAGGR